MSRQDSVTRRFEQAYPTMRSVRNELTTRSGSNHCCVQRNGALSNMSIQPADRPLHPLRMDRERTRRSITHLLLPLTRGVHP